MLPEFVHFVKLPVELRLVIWKMTIECRIITVKADGFGLYRLDGKLQPPPLLHVCRESRTQALFYYTPFLRLHSSDTSKVGYISYAHDSIFLHKHTEGATIKNALACFKPDLFKIQSLVIDIEFIQANRAQHTTSERLVSLIGQELTELREVILLTRKPRLSSTDGSKHVITLKNVRLLEHGPLSKSKCYLWSCEGELDDKSLDARTWTVFPNRVWTLDVNCLGCLAWKKAGPYGLDGVRRLFLIQQLPQYGIAKTLKHECG